MRVLIVHPGLSFYGGAELLVVKLANYLTRKGIENTIATLSVSDEIRKDLKGTRLVVLREQGTAKSSGMPKLFNFVKGAAIMWDCVQKNKGNYDVINVHNFPS